MTNVRYIKVTLQLSKTCIYRLHLRLYRTYRIPVYLPRYGIRHYYLKGSLQVIIFVISLSVYYFLDFLYAFIFPICCIV